MCGNIVSFNVSINDPLANNPSAKSKWCFQKKDTYGYDKHLVKGLQDQVKERIGKGYRLVIGSWKCYQFYYLKTY